MQNTDILKEYEITSEDCEMGMILINQKSPNQRWQGSEAAEEIVNLLPMGKAFIAAYRALPGMKLLGDRTYEQIRDNRYQWFGKCKETYHSPFGCHQDSVNQ
jgi:predicted DCC family thiol-disulfide oxidoreductase YuxK